MLEKLKDISEKRKEAENLLLELRNIAILKERFGVERHHIIKQRRVYRYNLGQLYPSGSAEIILNNGEKHTVPDSLLNWNQSEVVNGRA